MQTIGTNRTSKRLYNSRVSVVTTFGCDPNHSLFQFQFLSSFQPPGQLSAGLTCDFNITFEPKVSSKI